MAMQASAPAFAVAGPAEELRTGAERLRLLLLWLTGAAGAMVFIEPSPYEVVSLLALAVFVLTGLAIRPALLPLAVLLILVNIGFTLSSAGLVDKTPVVFWVATSWYMALTSLFFAAALCANTEARLDALMRGCVIAGAIAALAGVAAYFRVLPGSDGFLLYGRARGTFKDPNVFGAFLVLPALLALQQVIVGRFWSVMRNMVLLAIMAAAILLSFSRGAWGMMAFTAALVLFLSFITTRSSNQRLRIVLIAGAGVAVLALFIAALLSIGAVADLFKERVSLEQSYDVGETGRFGRHLLGALLALDVPLGIGPLQFSRFFPEDPHNTYLNAFMAGGWLSGVCYATLVLLTLAFGLRAVFAPTPWQSTTIVLYAAYVGIAAENFIIDTDHWRHHFLLIGAVWGLIAAAWAHEGRRLALVGQRGAS